MLPSITKVNERKRVMIKSFVSFVSGAALLLVAGSASALSFSGTSGVATGTLWVQ